MTEGHRSLCPINLSLEVFGDRWTLLILRDVIFGGRRHFRELLQSQEGISSSILADPLHMLVEAGLLTRADDPTHRQKAVYSLTERGIQLVPVFAHIGAWGRRWLPASEALSIRAQLLEEGGPALWEAFMAELREAHLGTPAGTAAGAPSHHPGPPRGPSVAAGLQAAYEAVVARQQDQAAPADGGGSGAPARAGRRPRRIVRRA